ncbi:LOW QUALITY PROTEIN: hypothetical protein PHMEG_00033981 [Phytophthora megakarya]|uniref:Uncharacterized protein n=1 Tax=Phytophthora megakarya TaxID=4795 RepID=A0A225URW1_9STRA|nr:LOW QUALITY PROTEIN: hypothetical protein PHMEG_00033981 [Phytophthora megakarya]
MLWKNYVTIPSARSVSKTRNDSKSRSCSVEQTRAIPAKADDSASRKIAQGSSKYAFIPRPEQVAIHDRVTAEKHKVWFGPNTQTSKHFQGYVHGRTIFVLDQALLSNSRYARDFCCFERVELIDNIVKFIQETLMLVSWSTKELTSLVYWVNDVLEDFRDAVESNGDISTVSRRCTTEDRLLRDIMFYIVKPNISSSQAQQHFDKMDKEIFMHIIRQLSVQVDPASGKTKQLCMRYLSQVGYALTNCEHGHFVPNSLPDLVKTEIIKRLGGLKDENQL